ncbi:hypothetical protein R4K55_10705 [Brachyspira alvinipulli]|uniref:hypothetical protein n=1 Tax=Brachyspira alvinipulli TaxID=84379 RepID=UPI00300602E8
MSLRFAPFSTKILAALKLASLQKTANMLSPSKPTALISAPDFTRPETISEYPISADLYKASSNFLSFTNFSISAIPSSP